MVFVEDASRAVEVIKERSDKIFETPLIPPQNDEASAIYMRSKQHAETVELPKYLQNDKRSLIDRALDTQQVHESEQTSTQLVLKPNLNAYDALPTDSSTTSIIKRQQILLANKVTPKWHSPWKLMRVVMGHTGWVQSVCVDPTNKWYATGSNDSTIKIWDLATSDLRLTLTGHIMGVRGLVVSERSPYLFSCSDDKTVKCWDLEKNMATREYFGHVGSVLSIDLHPELDILVTAGRDSVVRVWDIRTRVPIHVISGHKGNITNVRMQSTDPQIVSTSMDSTVRTYDLVAGKTSTVLTHHKKAVKGLVIHPTEYTMASGSADGIKQWKFPECSLIQNIENDRGIINTMSINDSNVLFSGCDNGNMGFYDWETGHKFQDLQTTKLPGSLESETGIIASTFDKSGLRLITCEADKSVKFWKEDPDATPDTHPIRL